MIAGAAPQGQRIERARDDAGDLRIAIVGMGCRLPGAATPEALWANISAGRESIERFSADELRAEGVPEAVLARPNYVPAAPVLDGIDRFDARRFGFTAREAALLDPQHRCFLECTLEALERAAFVPSTGDVSVGIFAGANVSTYMLNNLVGASRVLPAGDTFDLLIHNDKDYLATRVAYKLGLTGPSVAVQTACSTSLVAVHLACQSLLDGECDTAIAGGVSIRVPHRVGYLYEDGLIFSPDGHCRPFDTHARGTVFGSGAGVVVLRRLEDALAEGDPIEAVILGSAINNDGAEKVGFTAPSIAGQTEVISTAIAVAGVDPATITAVEAHGTGTPLGDPIELAALRRALASDTPRTAPCLVSSIKSNVGHLDTAAGIAGLLKAVLQLRHGRLAPTVHFAEPNPQLPLQDGALAICDELRDWECDGPRRIGVSSFGIGGTNAHVVLEEAPGVPSEPAAAEREAAEATRRPQLIVVSGHTRAAVEQASEALAGELATNGVHPLADVAHTLQTGRQALRHRRAVVAADHAQAGAALAAAAAWDCRDESPRVVYMLPGQGAQHPGMACALYDAEPVFRDEVDSAAAVLAEPLGFDLRELLLARPGSEPAAADAAERLRQTAVAQPALFVVEYALAALLGTWGIEPAALIGHSVGELVAACLAGVLEHDAALRIVAARGALMQAQPPGAMLSVGLPGAELEPLLSSALCIAATNAPGLSVASGPQADVEALAATLRQRNVAHHQLHTSHAFHSAAMDPVVDAFRDIVAHVELAAPRLPFVSNVSGAWITAEQATDADYWGRQLRASVRFADGIACVTADVAATLVEVGPGRALSSLARQGIDCSAGHVVVQTMPAADADDDGLVALLSSVGRLWAAGVDVDWALRRGRARRLSLAPRPLQAERHWVAARAATADADAPAELLYELPEIDDDEAIAQRPVTTPFVAPRSDAERAVAALWEEFIGVAPIGVHDDFFELGGHSLAAAQIVARMRDRHGLAVKLRDLVQAPTVEALAKAAGDPAAAGDDMQAAAVAPEAQELERIVPDAANRYEPFPLTELQQAQWIGRLGGLDAGGVAAHVYLEFESGELDGDELVAAWWRLVEQHDMLRAIVLPDGRQQVLQSPPRHEIERLDLRALNSETAQERTAELRDRMQSNVRPPGEWPLWELVISDMPGGAVRTHLSFDLLLADVSGLFFGIMRDWRACYERPDEPAEPLELSFRDYVIADQALRDTPEYERALDYWRERVSDLPPAPELPIARALSELEQPVFGRRNHVVAPEQWEYLKAQALRHGVTPTIALLSAYAAALGTFSARQRFTLNLTTVNRRPFHPDVDRLVGEFASFALLEVDAVAPRSFAELARQILERSWADLEHSHVSGVRVLRELARERRSGQAAVMPVVFTSTVGHDGAEPPAGWLGELMHAISQTPQVTLDMFAMESAGGLDISCHAIEELFAPGLLDELFAAFVALVESLADGEAWERAPLVAAPAHQLARRAAANDTGGPLPAGTLADAVLSQATQRPDAPAVIAEDRVLTHAELSGRAVEVARLLSEQGIGAGAVVGVSLPKGWRQVVAALGIAAAGGCYVPIDAEHPVQRRRMVAEHAGLQCVLVEGADDHDRAAYAALGASMLAVPGHESAWRDSDPAAWRCPALPSDVAYIIYTSGSTGVPKGVAVSHRAALNTCVDIRERFEMGRDDRVLGLSSLAFDLSVFDVFGVLGGGGALVLPNAAARRDPAVWERLVREHDVTVWNSVPALAQMLVDHLGADASALPLQVLMLSGDWIPIALPERLRACCGSGARVFSLGGATEAAIWSIWHPAGAAEPGWDSVPYGRPLRNQRFHVLNQRLEPCPDLVSGELYIGGAGLAEGYWRDPQRTAQSFFEHPRTGERLYRTGDLGRYRENGVIEFLGRADLQVKIGGYRIELGDVEQSLLRDPDVRAAVVLARGDRHHRRLVAYLVPALSPDDPQTFAAGVIARAGEHLPSYMVPATVIVLETLPLNANGKVDRAALPEPEHTATDAGGPLAPGLDEVAERLAAVVAKTLQLESVGIHDNFFELGGDSIMGVQVIARAADEGLEVVPQDLFEHQTIAALVAALHADGRLGAEPAQTRAVPLTVGQRQLLAPIGAGVAQVTGLRLTARAGKLDGECAEAALSALIRRHDALRLRLRSQPGDMPLQSAVPAAECSDLDHIPELDLRALSHNDRARLAEEMVGEMATELDPVAGPVTKAAILLLDDERCELVWLAHQLAVDRATWPQLAAELCALYEDARRGAPLLLPVRPASMIGWAAAAERDAVAGPSSDARPDAPDTADVPAGETTDALAALPAPTVAQLRDDLAAAYRMDLAGGVVAALVWALADAGVQQPSVALALDARDGHEIVGCCTRMVIATLALHGCDDAGAVLAAVKPALTAAAEAPALLAWPPDGVPHALLLGGVTHDLRVPEGGPLVLHPAFGGPEEWCAGPVAVPVQVLPALVAGELRLRCRTRGGDAAALAAAIEERLLRIAEHCGSPHAVQLEAADFPLADLGPGGIDDLLSRLAAGSGHEAG